MASLTIKSFSRILRFFWLTGPLFDKELRVSSRRKRNYFLRFAYVLLLAFFVVGTWASYGQVHGSLAYQKSRLAEIGKNIVLTIVIFQFFAAQIIAVIILSNSISDEIYNRTLGVLMTTPINSLQIVIGKLFSKLLQIIILLAISLPILAIVRVFGGVPWNYIFSSFCITLCAAVFAGSVSLAFSIKNNHTYAVIIKAFFALAVLYVFLPIILAAILGPQWIYVFNFNTRISNFPFLIAFLHLNPLGMITLNTAMMLSPSATALMPFYFWPVHCIVMLIASTVVLAFSVKVVRKVALRQILGQLDFFSRVRMSWSKPNESVLREYEGSIREVTGMPLFWKEVRKPLIQGVDNSNSKIGLGATVVTLLLTYFLCYQSGSLDADFTHTLYIMMFTIIGMIFVMVLSVSCITSEKESSAWPILLTTPLNDWQIVQGKVLGVFYRCLPVWLLLEGHVLLFVLVGYIHPVAIVQLPVILVGHIIFLTGVGLYSSSLFKRTTWAIISFFAFILVLWMFVPIILTVISELTRNKFTFGMYYSANPIVQVGVVAGTISGALNAGVSLDNLKYHWPMIKDAYGISETQKLLILVMVAYTFFGMLFVWMAKSRIRRKIF